MKLFLTQEQIEEIDQKRAARLRIKFIHRFIRTIRDTNNDCINPELARQNFKNLHRIKLKLNRNSKAVLVFVKDAGSWMLTKISIFKRRFCS